MRASTRIGPTPTSSATVGSRRLIQVYWIRAVELLADRESSPGSRPAGIIDRLFFSVRDVKVPSRSVVLLLAVFSIGANARAAGAGYFFDSNECAQRHSGIERIELNAGMYTKQAIVSSPVTIELSRGLDHPAYGECMRRRGRMTDVSRNPSLQIIADCQKEARIVRKASVSTRGYDVLPASHDLVAYERCLQDHTQTLDVEVEVPPRDE